MPFLRTASLTAFGLLLLAATPRSASACVYWPPDWFAPLPACNVHNDSYASAAVTGTEVTIAKGAEFAARLNEVRREVKKWQNSADLARGFTNRVESYVGAVDRQVDALPSFISEFNRENLDVKYMLNRTLAGDQRYVRVEMAHLVDSLRNELKTDVGFNRIYGIKDKYLRFAAYRRTGLETAVREAGAPFAMTHMVDSTVSRLRSYSDSISRHYQDRTDVKGVAEAQILELGGRLNSLRAEQLSLGQRAQLARIMAIRSMAELQDDEALFSKQSAALRAMSP
jgi:hypothetical protein